MSDIEIALVDIVELTTRKFVKKHELVGLAENRRIAKEGGEVASNMRKDVKARLGKLVVTKDNSLKYKYVDESTRIENK